MALQNADLSLLKREQHIASPAAAHCPFPLDLEAQ